MWPHHSSAQTASLAACKAENRLQTGSDGVQVSAWLRSTIPVRELSARYWGGTSSNVQTCTVPRDSHRSATGASWQLDRGYGTACRLRSDEKTNELLNIIGSYSRRICSFRLQCTVTFLLTCAGYKYLYSLNHSQTERQTDRETDKQSDRQTDRQTDSKTQLTDFLSVMVTGNSGWSLDSEKPETSKPNLTTPPRRLKFVTYDWQTTLKSTIPVCGEYNAFRPYNNHNTLWRHCYIMISKEYLTNGHILSIYFEYKLACLNWHCHLLPCFDGELFLVRWWKMFIASALSNMGA